MKDIYTILKDLNILYEKCEHAAVFTAEEADVAYENRTGARCKNLFLRNKKGNKHFLVIVERSKKTDIKKVGEQLGEKHLSFASPERLKKCLGLTPGAVTPFGLINDTSHEVIVGIDPDLLKEEYVNFHPNMNTATLLVKVTDFTKFLDWAGNTVIECHI